MTTESNPPQQPIKTPAEPTEGSLTLQSRANELQNTVKNTAEPAISVSASETPSPAPPASKTPRQILSSALLQGDREVQIVHGEEVYRLSLTRQGKLILHK